MEWNCSTYTADRRKEEKKSQRCSCSRLAGVQVKDGVYEVTNFPCHIEEQLALGVGASYQFMVLEVLF
jgi:hypothetical protein